MNYEEKLTKIKALLAGEAPAEEEVNDVQEAPAPQYLSVADFNLYKEEQDKKFSEGIEMLASMIQDAIKESKEVPVEASAEEAVMSPEEIANAEVVDLTEDPDEVVPDAEEETELSEVPAEDNQPAAEEVVVSPEDKQEKQELHGVAASAYMNPTLAKAFELINK